MLLPDRTATREMLADGIETRGASLGGDFSWLFGASAVDLAHLGPFIVAGPVLIAALSGGVAGPGTEGIVGVLRRFGIPEYTASHYETHLRSGAIMVCVTCQTADERNRAREIFQRAGAKDIVEAQSAALLDKAA